MKTLSPFETTFTEDLYKIPSKTTIALNCKWQDVPPAERELLSKILNSVKLSLAAVRIVFVDALQLSDWVEKPKKLIGFGLSITGVAGYEVITTPDTQLVLADSLPILIKDDELKKKLWSSLKLLFSV